MRSSAVVVAVLCVSLFHALHAKSFFPCHSTKASVHNDVKCTSVKLPPRLCGLCPLRPTLQDGSFDVCDRIYDTTSPACMSAMRTYVNDNECDARRREALDRLEKNGDEDARSEIDYFLYSVCEQCCDCVPMGVKQGDFAQLSKAHSASSPTLWSATRGNCPAHARYDVCKVLPSIATFTADKSKTKPICPSLNKWINTPAAEDWQTNPEVTLAADIEQFLNGMLVATHCGDAQIWNSCQQMEFKQHHLDLPAGFDDADATSEEGDVVPRPTPAPGGEIDLPVAEPSSTYSSSPQDTTQALTGDSSSSPTPSASASVSVDAGEAAASSDASSGGGNGGVEDNSGTFNLPLLSGIRSCFPASARVLRRDGRRIRMDQVSVGDEIEVGENNFSAVYAFSHRVSRAYSQFVELRWKNGSVALTGGHRIRSNGELKVARDVREGDVIYGADGSELIVEDTRMVWDWGLYNAHTFEGEVVVNGVLCSTFTEAVEVGVAQGLLTPFRALFRMGVRGWVLDDVVRHEVFDSLSWRVR
ncbi:Protein qua-1 [Gracilariopsis chorda]|uniref:Protein qua-1 n=1 Tax=Gracilariopsis chorda TaxID=448386 RepID=A0A2V3IVT7_9FLOR|nr:Protein qua-1 [Gracilariopsis chorda]|eukprot:PXF46231.1 Protein qua-1 [Gracilariopsis chorda]